jgi:hypothetical protein
VAGCFENNNKLSDFVEDMDFDQELNVLERRVLLGAITE